MWPNTLRRLRDALRARLGIIPTTVPSWALPPTLTGTAGNLVTYPQWVTGRGPNADKMALGYVAANGNQNTRVMSLATGAQIGSDRTVRVGEEPDDHNPPANAWFSTGELLSVACSHDVATDMQIDQLSADGSTRSKVTITYPGLLTYPNLFIDKFDKAWLFVRSKDGTSDYKWYVATKQGPSGSWSSLKSYFVMNDLSYSLPRYDPVGHRFNMFLRPNNGRANAGDLRTVALDAATGEFSDADGGLGFISGAASANGKVLPFDLDSRPLLLAKNAGKKWVIYDFSPDVSRMVLLENDDSNLNDVPVRLYRLTGGSRFNIANYQASGVITNLGSRASVPSEYNLGAVLGRGTYSGERLMLVRRPSGTTVEGPWFAEQWDNPSGDLSTWTSRPLAWAQGDDVMFRPMHLEGSTEGSSLALAEFGSFIDLAGYSAPIVRFVPTYSPTMHPITQAYIARMQTQPNDAWAWTYDRFIKSLVLRGYTPDLVYFMTGHSAQAATLNMMRDAFNGTLQGGLTAASWQGGTNGGYIGDGIAHFIDTGLNPASSPGIAMSRDSTLFGVLSRTSGQLASPGGEISNTNNFVNVRNTSNQFSGRVNSSTSPDGIGTVTDGSGFFTIDRWSPTATRRFRDGSSVGTSTLASAAPANDTFKILQGRTNTGPGYSNRRVGLVMIGPSFGVTDSLLRTDLWRIVRDVDQTLPAV